MSSPSIKRAKIAYYICRLSTASFIIPIYPIFLASLHISIANIIFVSNITLIATIILEVPIAYLVADKLSKKMAWIISLYFFTMGLIIYSLSQNLWHVISAEFVYGIGAIFRTKNPEVLIVK